MKIGTVFYGNTGQRQKAIEAAENLKEEIDDLICMIGYADDISDLYFLESIMESLEHLKQTLRHID